MIDEITIDKIRTTANIIDVIKQFVHLEKRGTNYVGICPFHEDKNPSMYVSSTKGYFKCFSCGEGGDAISFVMKYKKVNYIEALKWLAQQYNIEIPEEVSAITKSSSKTRIQKLLYNVNAIAKNYYREALCSPLDVSGCEFLKARGITEASIEKYQLGYSPFASKVVEAVKNSGIDIKYLVMDNTDIYFKSGKKLHVNNGVGIVYQRDETKQFIDRYKGRVIFPWFNEKGDIIGFGGRVIQHVDHAFKKYVNSPESMIMHKAQNLYGLYQASHSIAKLDMVYVVEGYMDVISMSQAGIENVVACSGTALSEVQVKLLKKYTNNVCLMLDADKAGQSATIKNIDILLSQGANVYAIKLPDGEDPDTLAHRLSAEDFSNYLKTNQQDFLDYKLLLLAYTIDDPQKMAETIKSILNSIALISDGIKRELFFMKAQKHFNINEKVLRDYMRKIVPRISDEPVEIDILEEPKEKIEYTQENNFTYGEDDYPLSVDLDYDPQNDIEEYTHEEIRDDEDFEALWETAYGADEPIDNSSPVNIKNEEIDLITPLKPKDLKNCLFDDLKVYARSTEDPEALYWVGLRYLDKRDNSNDYFEYTPNPNTDFNLAVSYLKRSADLGYEPASDTLRAIKKKKKS